MATKTAVLASSSTTTSNMLCPNCGTSCQATASDDSKPRIVELEAQVRILTRKAAEAGKSKAESVAKQTGSALVACTTIVYRSSKTRTRNCDSDFQHRDKNNNDSSSSKKKDHVG
jgi:hypothetical protein